ncbi:hypothetical protein [Nocardia sp. NPDC046763]|uniref:hypothetical protein n=1 Tax=Nocardia sp. NPDC046763 TaxID=3155256 RepID=UPI0033E92F47
MPAAEAHRVQQTNKTRCIRQLRVGIDLADRKQMIVVCDRDSKVLAHKTFRCRA